MKTPISGGKADSMRTLILQTLDLAGRYGVTRKEINRKGCERKSTILKTKLSNFDLANFELKILELQWVLTSGSSSFYS